MGEGAGGGFPLGSSEGWIQLGWSLKIEAGREGGSHGEGGQRKHLSAC